jgi:membrane-associated PAP2 superfamily phosphatase
LAIGAVVSFGQQARGAHCLSHGQWSAGLAWFICLGRYAFARKGRVMSTAPAQGGAATSTCPALPR